MSEQLPRRYLGAIVGNGYLVPADPDEPESNMFLKFLKAADEGDEMARAILDVMPISQHEGVYTRSKYGVAIHRDKNQITLAHAHYPPSFKGKCMPELQRWARAGHYTARRLVAELTRTRMLDPDIEIYDTGR